MSTNTHSLPAFAPHLLVNSKLAQVGSVLKTLVESRDQLASSLPQLGVSPFHSAVAPDISIDWYFVLLCVNSGLQEEQAVVVLILIDRLCNSAFIQQRPVMLNSLTAHRIVLSTVLVCTKFYNDIYYSNSDIATISGVLLEELNLIEIHFLELIGYQVYVSTEELAHYEAGLACHVT